MSDTENRKFRPGEMVRLMAVPPELLRGLPREDKKAISGIVGKPIALVAYDEDGRAELEFTGEDGIIHFIYVSADFIRAAE